MILYIYILMSDLYPKLFTQDEITNDSFDLKKINKRMKEKINELKYFEKLTDASKLKVGYTVRYIRPDEDYIYRVGGRIKAIVKDKNDYLISIIGGWNKEWTVYTSKIVLFYRTLTPDEVKQKDREIYKAKKDLKQTEISDLESMSEQLMHESIENSSEESEEILDYISDEAKQLYDTLYDLENWFTCGYMKIIKKIWKKDSQHYFNKYKNCHFLNQFYISLDEDNRTKLLNEFMNQLTNHTLNIVQDAIGLYVWFYSLVGLGQLYIYLDYDVDSIQTPLNEFDFVDFLMHCKNYELEIIYKEYKKYKDN